MGTLVLDFGGREEGVIAALRMVVRQPARVLVLPKEHENELAYREFEAGLNEALESLTNGRVSSVQVHGAASPTWAAGVYRPLFGGGVLADWSGSAEGLSVEDSTFDALQTVEGLSYIALSVEESPEFEASHITEETFPWSDWRLVAGAVRGERGQWLVRRVRSP